MNVSLFLMGLLLTCLYSISGNHHSKTTIISSAFEHKNDFETWDIEICRPNALIISKDYARKGNSSARFEFKKMDAMLYNGYVRAELKQKFKSDETGEMWYGFSNFLPQDYFPDAIPELIAQWHGIPDWHLEEDWRSPPVSLEIKDDRYRVKVMWASNAVNTNKTKDGEIYYDLGPVNRNKWNDWVFHIRFRHTDEGLLEVWKNKVKVLTRKGPNSYNDQKYPYFKLGIYKWAWYKGKAASPGDERIVYMDEVKVGNRYSSLADVSP